VTRLLTGCIDPPKPLTTFIPFTISSKTSETARLLKAAHEALESGIQRYRCYQIGIEGYIPTTKEALQNATISSQALPNGQAKLGKRKLSNADSEQPQKRTMAVSKLLSLAIISGLELELKRQEASWEASHLSLVKY